MTYESVSRAEFKARKGEVRPGTKALHDTMLFMFAGSLRSGGIVAVRPVRGGSAWSTHSVGRAADWMVQAGTGPRMGRTPREIGDELAFRLVLAADWIGVQEVIWYRRRWTKEKGWRRYYGINQHLDHVHASQTQRAADNAAPYDDQCKWIVRFAFPGVG